MMGVQAGRAEYNRAVFRILAVGFARLTSFFCTGMFSEHRNLWYVLYFDREPVILRFTDFKLARLTFKYDSNV